MPAESVNTWDQLLKARAAGLPDIAISVSRGPSQQISGWEVWSPRKDLDEGKERPWWEVTNLRQTGTGPKIFNSFGANHKQVLADAKKWAEQRYGIVGWKRNRMRDYVDARVAKQFPLRKLDKAG